MVRWQSGESLHSPSGQEGVAQAQRRRRRAHSTGRRNSDEKRLGPDDRAIPSPRRPPGIIEIRRTSGDREARGEIPDPRWSAEFRLFLGDDAATGWHGHPALAVFHLSSADRSNVPFGGAAAPALRPLDRTANARIHLIAIEPSLPYALHTFYRGGVTTRFSRDTRPQVQKSMLPTFRGSRSRFLSADRLLWYGRGKRSVIENSAIARVR